MAVSVEERSDSIATSGPTPFIPFLRSVLNQSIPDRFEEQVRRYPDRLAVKAGHDALTYERLNETANRIAKAILTTGAREEGPAVILLEQGSLLLAAILGALKVGGSTFLLTLLFLRRGSLKCWRIRKAA